MNLDFLWGVFVGLAGGLVIGQIIGISNFRKGIEDGLRVKGLIKGTETLDDVPLNL